MLTIYKASAGSGKTFNLAFEYIKILLGIRMQDGSYVLNDDACAPSRHRSPERHRAILAITFTNAATEEMKSRILRQLNDLANIADAPAEGETPYAEMLCRAYRCNRPLLRKAAATALNELLNDYGSFNVSTIDSFFQTVLRTFSREIDHQGDYELSMERLDAIRQSVSDMLDLLNYHALPASGRLYRWIRDYMVGRMSTGEDYNFFNRNGALLSRLAQNMNAALDEVYVPFAPQMRAFVADNDRANAYLATLNRLRQDELDKIADDARRFKAFCDGMGVPISVIRHHEKRLEDLCAIPPAVSDDTFDSGPVKSLVNDGVPLKHHISKASMKACGISDADVDALYDALEKFLVDVWRKWCRCKLLVRMADSFVELEFIVMAEKNMEEFLRQANTMLISDSGELLSRIISDEEMPFIYERLGMQLENLLIDEFQDTSRLQWHNLKPLVSNALAGMHDNMIIGDVKQSIYRFRNSDSSLLDRVVPAEDFPDHYARGHRPEENTNRRSAPEIVRFNNTFFRRLAGRHAIASYANVVQTVDSRFIKNKIGGYVTLSIFDTALNDSDYMKMMGARMKEQHQAGYRWRDILILVRARREATRIVEYFLSNFPEIPILSDEALLLRNSPAVRTVMSMLALVDKVHTGDGFGSGAPDAPRYGGLADIADFENRFHFFVSQGLGPEEALAVALESDTSRGSLREQILAIRAQNPASLVALIEGIIKQKLSDEERRREQPYLAALQDRAIKHTMGADPSVAAFVAAYNRNAAKWAILAPASLDAVQIMTVHKSKGLERDCVHIPFGGWELEKADTFWLPMDRFAAIPDDGRPPLVRLKVDLKDPVLDPAVAPEFAAYAADERRANFLDGVNVMYVAFTRACRELNIYASSKKGFGAEIAEIIKLSDDDIPETVDLAAHSQIEEVEIPSDSHEEADDFDPEAPEIKNTATATVLTLGEPTKPLGQKDEDAPCAPPPYDVVLRSDARELISVDDVFAERLDTGNECESEITDAPDGSPECRRAARRGKLLHSILEYMATAADLDTAVAAHLNRGFIRRAEADEFRRLLADAFAAAPAEVAAWFDPGCEVFAERAIYDPAAGETYRPDRVVRLADGTLAVIDFKFTSGARRAHRTQVSNYRRLVAEIEGEQVQAWLWYPLLNKTVRV